MRVSRSGRAFEAAPFHEGHVQGYSAVRENIICDGR